MDKLVSYKKSTFLTGGSGVGKTVILNQLLQTMKEYCDVAPVFMIFSAQTSASRTQTNIEGKLMKKRKTLL